MKIAAYAQLHRGMVMPTGVGQHLIHMIRGLSRRPGIDVSILAPRSQLDQLPDGNPLAGIAARGLPLGRRWIEAMWECLDFPKVDHWCGEADWIYSPTEVYVAARRPRLAVTVHDLHAFESNLPWSSTPEHQAFRRRWARMMSPIIQNAACILTVSEFTRGRLCELLKVDPGRVAVIGNGIDPLYFAAPGCAEAPSPETDPAQIGLGGRPYVVVVGGLTRRKGGDLVLQVAQILQREQPEMRILVAGKGEPAFSAPASDLGNVVLLQHVPTIQLVKLLRGAMAAVMLSRYEGFGIPVVEAMAAGAPVIASRSGALPEVVGDAGLLLDTEDVEGTAAAIGWLSKDDGARDRYVSRGKARAEGFRWERCVERLVQALESR
jgi:glycosyltransferase involved in cell wall biosynthesis